MVDGSILWYASTDKKKKQAFSLGIGWCLIESLLQRSKLFLQPAKSKTEYLLKDLMLAAFQTLTPGMRKNWLARNRLDARKRMSVRRRCQRESSRTKRSTHGCFWWFVTSQIREVKGQGARALQSCNGRVQADPSDSEWSAVSVRPNQREQVTGGGEGKRVLTFPCPLFLRVWFSEAYRLVARQTCRSFLIMIRVLNQRGPRAKRTAWCRPLPFIIGFPSSSSFPVGHWRMGWKSSLLTIKGWSSSGPSKHTHLVYREWDIPCWATLMK